MGRDAASKPRQNFGTPSHSSTRGRRWARPARAKNRNLQGRILPPGQGRPADCGPTAQSATICKHQQRHEPRTYLPFCCNASSFLGPPGPGTRLHLGAFIVAASDATRQVTPGIDRSNSFRFILTLFRMIVKSGERKFLAASRSARTRGPAWLTPLGARLKCRARPAGRIP
jgi:hypothetical protein